MCTRFEANHGEETIKDAKDAKTTDAKEELRKDVTFEAGVQYKRSVYDGPQKLDQR